MTLDQIIAALDSAAVSGRASKHGKQLASACIEKRSAASTFVLDNPKGARIFDQPIPGTPTELYLVVENPTASEVAYWKYDGCFIQRGGADKRCDLILMDTQQIAFVEIKLSADSESESQILENRDKGLEQLETSFVRVKDEFRQANQKWPFSIALAYLVTPPHYPNVSPLSQNDIFRFETELDITLQEANPITFP